MEPLLLPVLDPPPDLPDLPDQEEPLEPEEEDVEDEEESRAFQGSGSGAQCQCPWLFTRVFFAITQERSSSQKDD